MAGNIPESGFVYRFVNVLLTKFRIKEAEEFIFKEIPVVIKHKLYDVIQWVLICL